ncbi:MAG TPA: helix-hairpin-helix domain-containing protein, partial [Puia sp.]
MLIDNDYIASQLALLAKLMDIHGENSFKTRSYSVAAYTIEKLPTQLTDLPPEKITGIKGIGDAIGKKIRDMIDTGELKLLRQYLENTPPGIIEMLGIKGLGPKKIATIWKEMDIESIGELLYACQENRLLLYKGFGEKTQNNVQEAIEFYLRSQGSHLYADVETYALSIDTRLKENFRNERLALTGEFNRQLEVINQLEWITTISPDALKTFFEAGGFTTQPGEPTQLSFKGAENVLLLFHLSTGEDFENKLFQTSCSEAFLEAWKKGKGDPVKSASIPPFLRENPAMLDAAAAGTV